MLAAAAASAGPLPSVEARRNALVQLSGLAGGDAETVAGRWKVEARPLSFAPPGSQACLGLRLYTPSSAEKQGGAVVYVHGGGWVAGDLETHDGVCRALAHASGARVLAVDYRRPPEHRFPAAVRDAVDAVMWARSAAKDLGVDPARIALAGDSAGGGIAAAAAHLLASRGEPLRLLALLCPILELEPLYPSRTLFSKGYFVDPAQFAADLGLYLGDPERAADPLASPLRLKDLANFPPVRLHLAEFDPFRDEGRAFGERLAAAGVLSVVKVHKGMIHYFYALAGAIPTAWPILEEIGAEMREALVRR